MVRALLVFVGMTAIAGVLVWRYQARLPPPELCDALGRDNVIHVIAPDGDAPRCEGVRVSESDTPSGQAWLDKDAVGLDNALSSRDAGALLWPVAVGLEPPAADSDTSRALYLGPAWQAIAAADPVELDPRERRVLARVARGLLHGAREPRLSAFPPSLRRVRRVELMVLLRRGAVHRLWRSARGRSIAQALLTATRVARDRWAERQAAMGGSLRDALQEMTVEVFWLRDAGTLGASSRRFLDAWVPPGYGLGIDYRNGWHYVLPASIEQHGGSATDSLLTLLGEQGIGATALGERGSRLYRFEPVSLGMSPPSDASGAAGSSGRGAGGTGVSGTATGSRTVNVLP